MNGAHAPSFQDYRANAEKAKRELDGQMRKGRALKVRFAPHSAAVKVKNLTPWVSNELLEKAFAVFGEVSFSVIDSSNAIEKKMCM
jgi:proline- and glutamine-rich splicing factor